MPSFSFFSPMSYVFFLSYILLLFTLTINEHKGYMHIIYPVTTVEILSDILLEVMHYFMSPAYERGHQRPPLTVYTFQAPEASHSQPASPVSVSNAEGTVNTNKNTTVQNSSQQPTVVASPQKSPHKPSQNPIYARPPIPQRCSSLERPSVPAKTIATSQHRPAAVATTIAKQQHIMQLTKTDVPKIPKSVMQHVHLGKGGGYTLFLVLSNYPHGVQFLLRS